MWRRVSCEQQLHTSQSILSTRGNPMAIERLFEREGQSRHVRKGIRFIFRNLAAEPF